MRALPVALAVLLLAPLAQPASEIALLARASGEGSGFAVFRFHDEGSAIRFSIFGEGASFPNFAVVWLFRLDGDEPPLIGHGYTGNFGGRDGAYVDLAVTPGAEVDDLAPVADDAVIGFSQTIEPTPDFPLVGDFAVVLSVPSKVARWTAELSGGPTARLLSQESGAGAWFRTSEDFEGVATVSTSHLSSGVRANALTSLAADVRAPALGGFLPWIAGADVLTVQAPGGDRVCPCWFDNLTVSDASQRPLAPGPHAFSLTGAGGPVRGLTEVLLFVVEADPFARPEGQA
ncbi:MAG TPA: hypothetical protein VHH36_09940 [Candidatus Thermoplasmatota archaeon]|nr:hypothetical protein [Candidatus Thermoplasmatota archaeon]